MKSLCALPLRRVLEDAGREVTEAIDGKEGMARFHESAADGVITDMLLPKRSALSIMKESTASNPGVKIIAITALAYDAFDAAEELGANATFEKPIQMKDLLETIDTLLDTNC